MTILKNELQGINGGSYPIVGIGAGIQAYLDMMEAIENIGTPVTCNHGQKELINNFLNKHV